MSITLERQKHNDAMHFLHATDRDTARLVEDVIALLSNKAGLPEHAKLLVAERTKARGDIVPGMIDEEGNAKRKLLKTIAEIRTACESRDGS